LSTSIYTTDRTLLPSIIGRPMPNPLRSSINAQRRVGSGPITAQPGRGRPSPPAAPASFTSRPYAPPGAYSPAAPVGTGLALRTLGAPTPTVAAAAYLRAVTEESESSLAARDEPVTSLAPAEEGLLRDKMLEGERAFRRGEYAQALKNFRLANDLSLGSPETILSMCHARFAMATDSYSAVGYLLGRVFQTVPELPLVPLRPREFYGQAGAYARQLFSLEEHCLASPADAEAQLVLAYFKWFDGEVAAAVQALGHANAAAKQSEDTNILEAVDAFWDGMVASGLVEGLSIEPPAEEPQPQQAPQVDSLPDDADSSGPPDESPSP